MMLSTPPILLAFTPTQGPLAPGLLSQIITIIYKLNSLIYDIGRALAILMVVIGGFYYMSGQPEMGKKIILATIVGLAIIAVAELVINQTIHFASVNF